MNKWILPLVIILCMPLLFSCVAPPKTVTVTTTPQAQTVTIETTRTVTATAIPPPVTTTVIAPQYPPSVPGITISLKRGQYLVAQDDTYLGVLDSQFTSDSIFNEFGKYGSEFSSTSIWNEFSKYGSEFSSLSAFNDFATKPPKLFEGSSFICYVTTNKFKNPRLSPYQLIAFAESVGWR